MSLALNITVIPTANTQPPQGLVTLLHGWGANALDLAPLSSVLRLPQCQFFYPDAPFPHPQVPGGRMWYDLNAPQPQDVVTSRTQLQNWLLSLEEQTQVPLGRTVLCGFSQGGAMTLDVGLTLPLAGLVCLSGYLHPVEKRSSQPPPVAIAHGTADPVVPVILAQQARNTLSDWGVEVCYQEFEGMGHEIQPTVVEFMRTFITEVLHFEA